MYFYKNKAFQNNIYFEMSREMIRFILTVSGDEIETREFLKSFMHRFSEDLDGNDTRNSPLFQELLSIFNWSDEDPSPKIIRMMQIKNILLNHLSEKHREILEQLIEEESEYVRKTWENLKNLDLGFYSSIREKL